jgi:hypothetical protein
MRPYWGAPYFGLVFWSAPYFGGAAAPPARYLEQALAAAIKADATLSGIIGARCYPVCLPESAGTAAALYYRMISRPRPHTLDGAVGISHARVQFGACSTLASDVAALASGLRKLFDGFRGTLSGIVVQGAEKLDEIDLPYEDPESGSDVGRFVRAVDFRFHANEPAATPAPFSGSAEDLESALVAALLADATLSGLLGTNVFPGHVPESVPPDQPAVWYRVRTRPNVHDLDGPAGTALAGLRFGAVSRSYSDVVVIADLVRLIFDGFAGSLGSVDLGVALAQSETDGLYRPDDGSDLVKFERAVDFQFIHRES